MLEVRLMPIARLVPAPYNPRKDLRPNDPAYKKLRTSIETFGLVEPLVWNETSGYVVGGHARLRILKELGFHEVPVTVVRLSAAREKALNVVLNNTEAQGRYDPTKLADLLHDLRELPELELSGFNEAMLRNLQLQPIEMPAAIAVNPDRVEVQLLTNTTTYKRLEKKLNELIHRFDLEVHVRYG